MTGNEMRKAGRAEAVSAAQTEKPTLDFAHQLDIAKELLAFGKGLLSGKVQAKTVFTRKDYVFFALADKCLCTHESIQILSQRELVDDAFALIRVLVESAVNATFVVVSDDQTAEDYANFPDFRDWIEFEQLKAIAPEITDSRPSTDVEELRRNYEKVKGRYKKNQSDWCDKTIFARASTIDAAISGDYNLMRILVNLPWRKASTYVHGTAASIEARVHQDNSGVIIHRKYEPKEAAGVLFMASMAMFSLLAITDMRLGKHNAETWHRLYDKWGGQGAADRGGF
jgi:hypothetical protein